MAEKVIRFPGSKPPKQNDRERQVSEAGTGVAGIPGLSADQEKALQLVLSGKSFVMVALEPTTSGADFFTAVHGQAGHLQDAAPHVDGVIQRALRRAGLDV